MRIYPVAHACFSVCPLVFVAQSVSCIFSFLKSLLHKSNTSVVVHTETYDDSSCLPGFYRTRKKTPFCYLRHGTLRNKSLNLFKLHLWISMMGIGETRPSQESDSLQPYAQYFCSSWRSSARTHIPVSYYQSFFLTLLPPSLNVENLTSLHQNINYGKEEVEQSDTKCKLSRAVQSE